jgi:dephospho-CoA kinase
MKQVIFGLVSQMAGGKETVKNYLEKNYQAESCRFSSILRDILDRLFIDQSRENIQKLSTNLREAFGQDVLAATIAKEVKSLQSTIIVVDGVRRFTDIKYLQKLENFYLLAIETEEKIRYQRLVKRGENSGDEKKSFQDFLNDHKKETEIEILEVIKKADYTVNNNRDFNNLYQQIDKIIKDRQNN